MESRKFSDTITEIYKTGEAEQMLNYLEDIHHKMEAKNASKDGQNGCHEEHIWDPIILWICPSTSLFHTIAKYVTEFNLQSLTSIGCGTGLLEWLIQEIADVRVTGIEINGEWWQSKYSPPKFIEHTYVDSSPEEVMQVDENSALFFCYFNNLGIFRKYLTRYRGPLLFIIGSCMGTRVTSPSPLDLRDDPVWSLTSTVPVRTETEENLMAIYVRRTH